MATKISHRVGIPKKPLFRNYSLKNRFLVLPFAGISLLACSPDRSRLPRRPTRNGTPLWQKFDLPFVSRRWSEGAQTDGDLWLKLSHCTTLIKNLERPTTINMVQPPVGVNSCWSQRRQCLHDNRMALDLLVSHNLRHPELDFGRAAKWHSVW